MTRTLLLVELKGGNDGLNTVIPYADERYRALRPTIGVPRERALALDERVALHPRLEPLLAAWTDGDLAIVQGVGYPSPNRSHFRSIEIWDTASAASQTLGEGWIAQAFDGAPRPAGAGVDCIVADTNALPATGPSLRTIVMQDAENFLRQAQAMAAAGPAAGTGNPSLRHLLAVRQEINAAARGLRDRLREAPAPAEEYAPDPPFGRELDLATRILASRVPVVAIKVALAGFDTHANQVSVHERLLAALAGGLATLRRNLVAAGLWNEVLVMTYSEFGRRVGENASGGTDHGTAAPLFVLGGGIRGGLYGASPVLSDLSEGDLRHAVDFREVFATVARGCWGVSPDYGLRQPRRIGFL